MWKLLYYIKKKLIFYIYNVILREADINIASMNISLIDNPNLIISYITKNIVSTKFKQTHYGEVFTPYFIINEMLDTLPCDLWTNRNLKWLDPTCGTGNFAICIYLRLINFFDKKHILENMLYMCELNEENCILIKNIFDINILSYKPSFMFDVVVGNPPFNIIINNYNKPIYNNITFHCITIANIVLLIIPSRWFVDCNRLQDFKSMMINRNDIILLKHYNKSSDVFGKTVHIDGGVCYFLLDKKYNGLCLLNDHLINIINMI